MTGPKGQQAMLNGLESSGLGPKGLGLFGPRPNGLKLEAGLICCVADAARDDAYLAKIV